MIKYHMHYPIFMACTSAAVVSLMSYSGTPLNGHPSKADTHDITDNSESPDCPSIHFNT